MNRFFYLYYITIACCLVHNFNLYTVGKDCWQNICFREARDNITKAVKDCKVGNVLSELSIKVTHPEFQLSQHVEEVLKEHNLINADGSISEEDRKLLARILSYTCFQSRRISRSKL